MKKEILIAIFAAITLAVAVWGYNFISGKNLFSANYTYYAYFNNVQDVNTATPVQIHGYEVGTVISISPDPNDIRRIRLEFTVKNSIQLPDYTVAELVPESPLGGKYIELVFDKMCEGNNCLEDKATIKGRNVGILGSMISDDDITRSARAISMVIDSTLGDLGAEDSTDAIDISIRNLAVTLEKFADISTRFNSLMQRSAGDMEKSLSNVAQLTQSLNESNKKVNRMLDDLSAVTADLKTVKFSETIDLTNTTLSQAEISMKTMESTMGEAKASLQELNTILGKISDGEGTVGKLMSSDDIYLNLESTTRNLDLLMQDLRLNPRRYFRLFGKKSREYEYPSEDPADLEFEEKGQ